MTYFNKTYAKQLADKPITEKALPPGDRIIQRIERALSDQGIKIRPSGGFNHYAVAATFGNSPPAKLDDDTAKRFSALFESLNHIF